MLVTIDLMWIVYALVVYAAFWFVYGAIVYPYAIKRFRYENLYYYGEKYPGLKGRRLLMYFIISPVFHSVMYIWYGFTSPKLTWEEYSKCKNRYHQYKKYHEKGLNTHNIHTRNQQVRKKEDINEIPVSG